MKGCSFTGHRAIPLHDLEGIKQLLALTVERAYNAGIRDFYSGGALGFDTLAAYSVIEFREKHPDTRLMMLLPCRDQDRLWTPSQREKYAEMLSLADCIEYVSESYDAECMRRRNAELVSRARLVICYLHNQRSGTAQTVRLAKDGGRAVWNLWEHLPKNL